MTTITEIVNCNCPDCKNPLNYYLQELHPRSTKTPNWIGTCETHGCPLHGTTLSDERWSLLIATPELAEQYREMNRQMAGAK